VGELWCKGPHVVKGYWNKPEATAATFTDGWVHTGDLARIDEEGFLFIIDRAKDMLIRGGENIYCIEVENALYEHPAVMDAAVVAVPHRTLGEEPGAVVHLTPGAEATETSCGPSSPTASRHSRCPSGWCSGPKPYLATRTGRS
jgi:long-chain acyl-CoA synthetase